MTARTAPAASRPRTVRMSARLRRWSRPLAAVLAAVALVATGITAAQSATPQLELLVNSVSSTADASPGDEVCADANGDCTLRAAIQESNTLNRAAGEIRIGVDPAFAGGRIDVTTSTSTWMRTSAVDTGGSISGDDGAIFEVTAPVIIDLEHKVTASPVSSLDGPGAAGFYLNGSDIELTGVDNTYTGETAFYVGPNASNVHIHDGAVQTANYYPERFLVVRGGASNITVSNYDVTGFASNDSQWGWGWVDDATSAATAVKGLTIDNVHYNANLSGSCNGSSATGCSSTPLDAEDQFITDLAFTHNTVINFNRADDNGTRLLNLRDATVDNLNWSGNTITNPRQYSGESLVDLGTSGAAATIGSFTINDNVFTDVQVASEEMNGVIRLPGNSTISGTGLISGNTMLAGNADSQAIYWHGGHGSALNVNSTGVVIEKNHFDGWGDNSSRSTIRMYQTGAVTIRQNTFGTATGTQTNTVTEEGTSSGSYATTMLSNWNYGANGKMNTWFPTARTSANVQSANLTAQRCTIDLEVAPPSDSANGADIGGSRYPATPVTLDLYWTAARTAEVYLESVQVASDARTTLQVELPLPGDQRLDHLAAGATLPVDPATGAVSGGIRLQTQDPNAGATAASSQYSRVAMIDGTCQPDLTIDQADTQNDPTLARDLHYTVRSTMPLDPASLMAADFGLTATATADTIDAARLNQRVESITPVTGSDNTEFDVIVRVDDSATVTASLAAGTVTSELGLANSQAATSTDNQITFTNPLVVAPPKFTLVTGEPNGKDYTIGLRAGAPEPGAELTFTATVDQTGVTHGVALSTTSPVIAVDGEKTDPINVTAADGQVTANTRVVISHEVSSADPNYDRLVVPTVVPHLFATDPTVEITKRAYTEVTDTSSPAQIEATGTEALSGTRLVDGQSVCWVYTVTNVSADDWATSLTDITVTDSDTRLGTGGVIGTIGTLGIGEQQKLSSCAVLIPSDTTAVAP